MGGRRPHVSHARFAGGRRRHARRGRGRIQAQSELIDLAGVGPQTARQFAEMGILTHRDLLAHVPRDYKDWRRPTPLATIAARALRSDEAFDEIAVARIASVRDVRARIPITSAVLQDESGTLAAVWYGRRGLAGRLSAGMRLFVAGRAQAKRRRGAVTIELNVTNHRILGDDTEYKGEIVPVYPASKDLLSRTIRAAIAKNLPRLLEDVEERLPAAVVRRHRLLDARAAWHDIHAPREMDDVLPARRRIIYEEFFSIALAAALVRLQRKREGHALALAAPPALFERFERALPFALTGAQRRVIEEIWKDLREPHAMNRLLQGDVGSGKTLVAAAAILAAADSGVQSALMAPTEILAAQHAEKLAPLLLPFGIAVEAVFGSLAAGARRTANERIASGEALLAIGTHALLTESVEFKRLGLVIIDEQHRFGVAQRAALRAKGEVAPHTLHMTATPIPRTLAQTRYADLDLSTIDEMPPGRIPIETYVVRESRKARVYEFVRGQVARGRQAYVVAPAIESGEGPSSRVAAVDEAERVRRRELKGLRVDLLHGRMPPREKDAAMDRFSRGETDVLIATTVVEVGVDVPNAALMVVLDAHRYGLAQLHQLRGRVGRGSARSYCVLVAPDDAAEARRLEVLSQTEDGFRIAEEDLRLRRAGEMAGTLQTGAGSGTFGDLVQDFSVYLEAKREADAIVSADPELERPENAGLRALVEAVPSARAILISS
ncbi:MAG: ATP-dependent DNA helicase RecG [Candidatus Eremiobacteraeota bacterium]|nr:ATP-dependent DNA helicase RecG [Candidatus Eremiobacteraeota bacterium]